MSDKKKMGRPVEGEPKTEQYRIRMTQSEMKKLDYCAKVTNMTKADVLRSGLEKVYREINDK